MELSEMKNEEKVEQKLKKTTNRIKKSRKNIKLAQKEAAEFEEIHKILDSIENEASVNEIFLPEAIDDTSECSNIPFSTPWLKVFNDDLLFSLFNEENICLTNFIDDKERCMIFGEDDSVLSEENFRRLVSSRVFENLMPQEDGCPSVSLYVLYLMSVHEEPSFVTACFDFLMFRPFRFRSEDIFPIFVNFGAEVRDLCILDEETLLRKFFRTDGNIDKISKRPKFPHCNLEAVGQILVHFITKNLLVLTSGIKLLVQIILRITLDSKIRSGSLSCLYSTLLTLICHRSREGFDLNEIASWLDLRSEHLLVRVEICRTITKSICSDLHEILIIKTISNVLESEDLPIRPPIQVDHIKLILKKLKKIENRPLELYSLLQLINSSLPGVTATVEDSLEINAILNYLDRKITQTDDSVDLVRLKLEVAKVRNLLGNNISNRFTVNDSFDDFSKEES